MRLCVLVFLTLKLEWIEYSTSGEVIVEVRIHKEVGWENLPIYEDSQEYTVGVKYRAPLYPLPVEIAKHIAKQFGKYDTERQSYVQL